MRAPIAPPAAANILREFADELDERDPTELQYTDEYVREISAFMGEREEVES